MSSGSAGRGEKSSSQQIRRRSRTSRLLVQGEPSDPFTWMLVREWAKSLKFVRRLKSSAVCALVRVTSWALGPSMRTQFDGLAAPDRQIEGSKPPTTPAPSCACRWGLGAGPTESIPSL